MSPSQSHRPFAQRFLSRAITAFVVALITAPACAGAMQGQVFFVLTRANDPEMPRSEFELDIEIRIPSDIDGVFITAPDETFLALDEYPDTNAWDAWLTFTSLNEAKQFCHGTWTIFIFAGGMPASTSTFTWNANVIVDADFFPSPLITNPMDGATGVSPCVEFTWDDPTGEAVADALSVCVEHDFDAQEQCAINLFGEIDTDATSWIAPKPLPPGFNEFDVFYGVFDDAGLLSPLKVTAGAMDWVPSMFAPPDYPPATPLLLLGTFSITRFHVSGECSSTPGDLNGDGAVNVTDLLLLLGQWGPCDQPCPPGTLRGCPADLNDDCTVNVNDLLLLLANWG